MRSRLTWGGTLPAAISLISVAVMSLASFMPFLQEPWPGTPIFISPDGVPILPLPTASIAQGPDASLVLEILVVLGVAAALHLLGIRRRVTGAVALGAALAVTLAGIYPTVVEPASLDYGYYLFGAGAAVAAIAGLAMVVISFRGTRLAMETAVPAAISLVAVAVMSGSAFLPYVQFPWTDGMFSLAQGSLPTGPLPTTNLALGSDAYLVLETLAVLGVAAAAHLVGMHRRTTAVACFAAALGALAVGVTFPASFGFPSLVGYGFYPFVAAAAVAAIAGLVTVVMSFRGAGPRPNTALLPSPS